MHQPPFVMYVPGSDYDNANAITPETLDLSLQNSYRTSILIRRPVPISNQHCSEISMQ